MVMTEHRLIHSNLGKHVVNKNRDDVGNMLKYIFNLENINHFKFIVGTGKLKRRINSDYNLDSLEKVQLGKQEFTVKDLSEQIRFRSYFIKNDNTVLEVIKELLHDVNALVDVTKKDFIVGIDNCKNAETIILQFKEIFDILEIKNYEIYIYDGIEKELIDG